MDLPKIKTAYLDFNLQDKNFLKRFCLVYKWMPYHLIAVIQIIPKCQPQRKLNVMKVNKIKLDRSKKIQS